MSKKAKKQAKRLRRWQVDIEQMLICTADRMEETEAWLEKLHRKLQFGAEQVLEVGDPPHYPKTI